MQKLNSILSYVALIYSLQLYAADPYVEGQQAYFSKDYTKAFNLLMPLAKHGHAKAQVAIGIMYDYGHGVSKNSGLAVEWYKKAAEQGLPQLQNDLGIKYFLGKDIQKNYAEAFKWWQRAANSGVVESQYYLGILYANGLGVNQNINEALHWYQLAASKHHARSMFNLGNIYALGKGVQTDYSQAYQWFKQAAEAGVPEAQYNLGLLYEGGHAVEKNLSEARKWFQLAANQGVIQAKSKLTRYAAQETVTSTTVPQQETPDPVVDTSANTGYLPTTSGNTTKNDHLWLKNQNPDFFTLQLATSADEQAIINYVSQPAIVKLAKYFKRNENNQVLYTVVYGAYKSRDQAMAALLELPEAYQKTKPWVRTFKAVQQLAVE